MSRGNEHLLRLVRSLEASLTLEVGGMNMLYSFCRCPTQVQCVRTVIPKPLKWCTFYENAKASARSTRRGSGTCHIVDFR